MANFFTRHKLLLFCMGAVVGITLSLLFFIAGRAWKIHARYQYCLNRDFSFIDLTKANAVWEDVSGTFYLYDGLKVVVSENDIVIFDDFTGQMRQYKNGVLFLLSVNQDPQSPSYQHYYFRTLQECEETAKQVQNHDPKAIQMEKRRIWSFQSGERFVD